MEPLSAGMAALGFARRWWKLLALGILLMLLAIQTVRLGHRTNQLERARIDLNEVKSERDNLIKAAREAEKLNQEQVKRIVSEQEKVNAEAKSRYERDIARVRAGGVRKDLAHPRNPTSPKAGSVPEAACRDDEENVCVSRSLVVQAAEIELKANSLIDIINDYLQIER